MGMKRAGRCVKTLKENGSSLVSLGDAVGLSGVYRMLLGGGRCAKAHFAKLHKDLVDVVLVCDRYSASKCLAKDSTI